MKKHVLFIFILNLSGLYAGTTGKITGVITDKETGEPLVGCNVLIENTMLGTSTDLEGSYFVLNVPPGMYNLKALMIGYTTVKTVGVQVIVDLTTTVHFELSTEIIEGQEVTVIAERPVVRLDQTSMTAVVGSDEIENLPVAEITDVVGLKAGIVKDAGGGMHIRGGRSGEVSFWVDGISTTDSYDGSSVGQEIQNSSIQEVQVISGTFNAEYGNAMSGIINVVTKDGGEKIEGGLEIYTGGYHTYDDQLFTMSSPFANWEPFDDLNGDGEWQEPEWFNDKNGNLEWDPDEPYDDVNENGIFDSGEPLNSDVGPDGYPGDPLDNGSMIPSSISNNNGQKNEPSIGEGDGLAQWGEHRFTLDENGYVDKLNILLNPLQIRNLNAHLSGTVPGLKNKFSFYSNLRYFNTMNRFYGKNLFQSNGLFFGNEDIVPLSPFSKLTGQIKLTYKPNPKIKIAHSFFYAEKSYKNYDSFFKYNPDGLMNRFEEDNSHIFTLTHSLSPKTYYDLKYIDFSSAYWEYLYEDETNVPFEFVIKDDLSVLGDSIIISNGVDEIMSPQYYFIDSTITVTTAGDSSWEYLFADLSDSEGYVDPVIMNVPAWSFSPGGTQGGRFERQTSYRMVKFDLSSQVNRFNQVKIGIELKRFNLWADDKSVDYLMEGGWGFSASGDTIGYNPLSGSKVFPFQPTIYPTHTYSHSYFRANPFEFSAYIQDKLELDDLILNFGLRFDYFDPDWIIPDNDRFPGNKKYFLAETINDTVVFWENEYSELHTEVSIIDSLTTEGAVKAENLLNSSISSNSKWMEIRDGYRWEFGYSPAPVSYQLSPRIGLSYPITDKGAIHVSYGYFFQIPNLEYLYSNPEFEIGESNFAGILGNAALKPEKTVMYEVGLKQEIAAFTSFDFTLFYRDTRDWVGIGAPINKFPVGTYYKYENKDYANTRGFTVAINRSFAHGFGFSLDYSWMVAEGTYSNPNDAYHSAQSDEEPLQRLIPLDWDQTHTLNGTVTLGGKNFSSSLIAKYWSGTPYTPEFKLGTISGASAFSGFAENIDRKPTFFEMDFRSSYKVSIAGLSCTLFCNIYNVFDVRNERTVWNDTGRGTYTLTAKDVPDTSMDRIGHLQEHINHPDWFSDPRKINIGLHINI